jgi:hypothetical protein
VTGVQTCALPILAAHRATTSSSRATFKFRLLFGSPPSYLETTLFTERNAFFRKSK